MKFTYPAVIRKMENGRMEAFFPDLEGCRVEAADMEDVLEAAYEAAVDWITVEMEEEHPQYPSVSAANEIPRQEGDIVRDIGFNIRFFDGYDE